MKKCGILAKLDCTRSLKNNKIMDFYQCDLRVSLNHKFCITTVFFLLYLFWLYRFLSSSIMHVYKLVHVSILEDSY